MVGAIGFCCEMFMAVILPASFLGLAMRFYHLIKLFFFFQNGTCIVIVLKYT